MFRRGPTWDTYQDTLEKATASQQELTIARQQIEDLKTLNKQLNTENQAQNDQNEVAICDAKYVNGLGKYMVPVDGSLENHYRLIYERSNELDFWPEQSPAFDGIVAQTFLDPAFSQSNHPRYFSYEPLRDNISTVRNYALQVVMSGVDVNNQEQMRTAQRKLEQMGREVGVALQRDSLFKLPGSEHLDVSDTSEPGVGAAKIYELLTEKQASTGHFAPVKRLFGYDYSDWGLPPIDHTPFNKENVAEFCMGNFARADSLPDKAEPALPSSEEPATAEPAQPLPDQTDGELSSAQQLSLIGGGMAAAAFSLARVEQLPRPVKDRSVELAREILDKLRIQLGGNDRDQWLELPAEAALAQNEAVESIATLYAETYQTALANNPALKDDPAIQQGNLAMGKLAYLMKQQAGMKLVDEGRMDDAQMIMAELEQYPQDWQSEGESVQSLLAQMQNGLEMSYHSIQQAQQKGLAEPQNAAAAAQNADLDLVELSPSALAGHAESASLSPQQLQNLLQQGNLSPQELSTVRELQAQANTMQAEHPVEKLQNHARNAARNTPATEAFQAQQGGYRNAVQSQQQSDFLPKR